MIYEFQLSENFTAYEARCRGEECCCHGAVRADRQLVMVLQHLRELWQEPITVTSWFRCDEYNREVEGHPRSFHRLGMAADLTSREIRNALRSEDGASFCKDIEGVLVGVVGDSHGNIFYYPERNFIHVDVGHLTGTPRIRRK